MAKSVALRAFSSPGLARLLLPSRAVERCRRKFLRIFPQGFRDATYLDWERDYKWQAHREWEEQLGQIELRTLLKAKRFREIADRAVKIESGRSLLFSFEKMALRDAVRSNEAAELFARALYEFLHGSAADEVRFTEWCEAIAALPRKQTRVLTWPLVTVFGFIAQPDRHIFLKPNTIKEAARRIGYDLQYRSTPNWQTYLDYLELAAQTRRAIRQMRPRDMIDIQSFLWVQGADEYR